MTKHDLILKLGGAATVAAVAAMLGGCSLRIQAPIREVAYDFSDRDFYDRAYAPSPTYAPSPQAYGEVEEHGQRGLPPGLRGAHGDQAPAPSCEGAGR